MQEIRVIDAPDQQFGVILNGRRCTFRLRYNVNANRWTFDLALDDDWVLHGRRVTLGSDLLASYRFDIGQLYCITNQPDTVAEPGYDELVKGIVRFYHVTNEEVEAFLDGSISP